LQEERPVTYPVWRYRTITEGRIVRNAAEDEAARAAGYVSAGEIDAELAAGEAGGFLALEAKPKPRRARKRSDA
jgi:hypothetical protein